VYARATHVPAWNSVPRSMGLGMATAGTLGAHAAWFAGGTAGGRGRVKDEGPRCRMGVAGRRGHLPQHATPWWRTAGGGAFLLAVCTRLQGGPPLPKIVAGKAPRGGMLGSKH
jgi:hypothetical protein